MYTDVIEKAGLGRHVWGFVDGTFQGFARPILKEQERNYYSGYYGRSGLKYQAIVTPDGLVQSLTPPARGTANDWTIWTNSGVPGRLRTIMNGHPILFLYGDPAYRNQYGIWAAYTSPLGHHGLTAHQQRFNGLLSRARITVENAFGKIQNWFTRNAFATAIQPNKTHPAAFYHTACLLSNLLTCFRGRDAISVRWLCKPPDVWEYLGVIPPSSVVLSDGTIAP